MMAKWLPRLFIVLGIGPSACVILAEILAALATISRHGLLYFLAGSLVAVVAAVVIHELGHLIAAWAVGIRVVEFIVGPFALVREGAKIRPRWRRLPWPILGRVLGHSHVTRENRWRLLTLYAAGPVASLIFGVTCFILVWLPGVPELELLQNQGRVGEIPTWAASWLNLVGLGSILMGFSNLHPRIVAGHPTDGQLLLDCLLCSGGFGRAVKLQEIWAVARAGRRPRDWDADALESLRANSDGTECDVMAHLTGFFHAIDCGRLERAGDLLAFALEHRARLLAIQREGVLVEGAYFEGVVRRDATRARQWLREAGDAASADESTRCRAEAAVLLAEGNYAAAAARAEAGLVAAPRSANPGATAGEIDWLNAILAECRQRLAEEGIPAE